MSRWKKRRHRHGHRIPIPRWGWKGDSISSLAFGQAQAEQGRARCGPGRLQAPVGWRCCVGKSMARRIRQRWEGISSRSRMREQARKLRRAARRVNDAAREVGGSGIWPDLSGRQVAAEIVDGVTVEAMRGWRRDSIPPLVKVETFRTEAGLTRRLTGLGGSAEELPAPPVLRDRLGSFLPPPPPLRLRRDAGSRLRRSRLIAGSDGRLSKAGRSDAARARGRFAAHCADCHGGGGQGSRWGRSWMGSESWARGDGGYSGSGAECGSHFRPRVSPPGWRVPAGLARGEIGQCSMHGGRGGAEHRVAESGYTNDEETGLSLMPQRSGSRSGGGFPWIWWRGWRPQGTGSVRNPQATAPAGGRMSFFQRFSSWGAMAAKASARPRLRAPRSNSRRISSVA